MRTVAMPAPVTAIAPGSDGTTFYVLHKTPRAAGVTLFDAQRGLREGSIPVPLGTVALVSTPSQKFLYCLEPSGLISQTSVTDGRLTSQFSVAGTGRSLALSPDAGTLYVLKGIGPVRNVAVVKLATQTVVKVLPAPADAEVIRLSPDGTILYDVVGTPAYSNIQVFPLRRAGA
jgi:DNA-binding beta-propeller fold protein YncE